MRLVGLAGLHVCHWCLLGLGSYTVEITVPTRIDMKVRGLGIPLGIMTYYLGFAW